MRQLLFKGLDLYRRAARLSLSMRGKTEESVAEERIVSGKAWEEFCDSLKAAGATLSFPGTPRNAFDQAEGHRYLTRLLRAGLENFIEHSDPKAPVLRRMVHETVKMGADNPDNYYQNCAISGEYEYRIRGRRGTVAQLTFATQAGSYGQGGGLPPTGRLDALDMEIDEDGRFEILLSRDEPKRGNWLPLAEDTSLLVVRQTFLDRETEEIAEMTIERIGGDGSPTPVTAKQIDDGLKQASALVAGASLLFAKWARDFQSHENQLPLFDPEVSTKAGGDPNITYYHSYWRLGRDEALLIEAMPPPCEHWNFQLNNYWMESLDYRYYRIHTNKHLASYESDGSIKIVVSHTDPGHPNWIQTVGHEHGTMCFRWVHAESPTAPRTRVVKMADLPDALTGSFERIP